MEGQLLPKMDSCLLLLPRMVISGHLTRKPEAYFGNLNYPLPPLQPLQSMLLKANSIWQLPVVAKNSELKREIK